MRRICLLLALLFTPLLVGVSLPTAASAVVATQPTTVSLTLSATTRSYSGPLTYATVQTRAADGKYPPGKVWVMREGGIVIGVGMVDAAGRLRVALPWLWIGTHTISVRFDPIASAAYAIGRTPKPAPLTVVKDNSTVALSGASTILLGHAGQVNVAVTAAGRPAPGTVTFYRNGISLGAKALDVNGRTILGFNEKLPAGSYTVKVVYNGGPSQNPATGVRTIVVAKPKPTIVATLSAASVALGQNPTLTVKAAGAYGLPTGTLHVLVDGVGRWPLPVKASQALTLTGIAPGTHNVSVVYYGDGRYQGARADARLTVRGNPCPAGAKACIDLTNQLTWLQSGGQIIYGPVPITSGRPGYRTPPGMFTVFWKDKNHLSSEFNNAPMPYSVFFNGGIAFHEGSLSVPSHGCIHLSYGAAVTFFNTLAVGDKVYAFGYAPY